MHFISARLPLRCDTLAIQVESWSALKMIQHHRHLCCLLPCASLVAPLSLVRH